MHFMIITNLKILFKQLMRNNLYTAITILGFSVSLTFVILLSVYIQQELSVDRFHANGNRIYRLSRGDGSSFAPPVGQRLMDAYPEIEAYTRLYKNGGIISAEAKPKLLIDYLLVDSAFFTMFSFNLVEGSPREVFRSKNGIVLTQSLAHKLFGDKSPIGLVVGINDRVKFTITGIIQDFPENTHFVRCDALLNFPVLADLWDSPDLMTTYSNSSFALYLLTKPNTNIASKEGEILESFKKDYWMYSQGFAKVVKFEPLTEIYFGGQRGSGAKGNSKKLVMVFSAIAVVILLLAVINYINLSVAQASTRSREVAVKKLHGSSRRRLIGQFIVESIVICLVAFNLALILAKIAEPSFNELLGTRLNLDQKFTLGDISIYALGIVLVGIVSGLIPSLTITSYKAIEVVKGSFRRRSKSVLGKMLISFQYCVAIILIICTWLIARQTQYMRNFDLGFNRDNIIYFDNDIGNSQRDAFRDEVLKIPGVIELGYAAGSPLDGGNNNSFEYKGKPVSMQVFKFDSAFVRMFGIRIIHTGGAQSKQNYCLNEAAIRELELDSMPKSFKFPNGYELPIFGVVKNFHFKDLHQQIGPAIVMGLTKDENPWGIYVQISGVNQQETLAGIKRVHDKFTGNLPFDYSFADETIRTWYEKEEKTAKMIGYFSVLAIIISVMGILAMATFYIGQRVKEIGIRKVNGATNSGIIQMLNFDLIKWVVISFILASPMAYYAINKWLANFPYKAPVSWWVFLLSGIIVVVFALLTITWQSWRTANRNPEEALRYE